MNNRLSLRDLIEGGLSLALANPLAVVLFVVADVTLSYGLLWAERQYSLSLALFMVLSTAAVLLTNLALLLAIGNRLGLVLSDPVELFTRTVFGLAAWLIGTIAMLAGALLLIVPGLYVLARLTTALPLIVLDGTGILDGLNRSWVMTERSAWPLTGIQGGILGLELVLSFFSPQVVPSDYSMATLAMSMSLVAISLVTAFGTAMSVFACRTLSPPPDELIETFA
jgi:hypothetical protein